MARLRERIFAGAGAGLFLISACAVTVFAVIQGGGEEPTDTSKSSQQACSDTQTQPVLDVPEIYKPDGVVTELQQTDLTKGSGAAAKAGDCLVMKYYGTLATDGTKFDENFTATTAFPFTLGAGEVITGWDQGLVGMKEGGVRRLVIPAALAYGDQERGSIPANSDLVFVVKLLKIKS